jgi:fatty acid CoA ligase FadD32
MPQAYIAPGVAPPAGQAGAPPVTSIAACAARLAAADGADEPAYTFVDYSADLRGLASSLSWRELDARARAVAAELRVRTGPGERAAILASQGLGYVTAMLGALYANVTAVPLFTPSLPGHRDRLEAILADADPSCVLTTGRDYPAVTAFLRDHRPPSLRDVVRADEVSPGAGLAWQSGPVSASDVAYLQYTSGSTRTPAGVMITHGCLSANAAQITAALAVAPGSVTVVSWLPLFHDMGLVMTVAMPVVTGNRVIFIDPAAFLMRPARWLQLASGHPDVVSAAPNFAYEYCADRIGEDLIGTLDLRNVRLLNGAEPVRPATLRKFTSVFSRCGLSPAAMIPAYGLAEATVYVSSAAGRTPARIVAFDRDELAAGRALPVPEEAPSAIAMVSCGVPAGQHVAIVNPQAATVCPAGQVGEIWVNGPNVAPGYYGNPAGPGQAFGAVLADPPGGLPPDGWLRTGDLGVLHRGELIVTGRLKDLIVVDGRNHYPQDIEATAQTAHPLIRRDRVAAFAVAAEDGDRVVVVAERARGPRDDADPAEVARAVRGAVAVRHDVRLHDFVLVKPGLVPRTSSGKISRSASRERYLAGAFGSLAGPFDPQNPAGR